MKSYTSRQNQLFTEMKASNMASRAEIIKGGFSEEDTALREMCKMRHSGSILQNVL